MGGHAQSEDDRRCSFELPIHPRYVVQKYFSSTLDRFTVFSAGELSFFFGPPISLNFFQTS
jgi:hypothetical protein